MSRLGKTQIGFSIVFAGVFLLSLSGHFDLQVSNFRLLFSKDLINELIQIMTGASFRQLQSADDPGFLVTYALSSVIHGLNEVLVVSDPRKFPLTLKLMTLLVQLGFSTLLIRTSEKLLPWILKLVLLSFFLMPNYLAVFFGYDVYLFPVYTTITVLYAWGMWDEGRFTIPSCLGVCILIFFCEFMRKGSLHFGLILFTFLGLSKSVDRKKRTLFLSVFVAVWLVSKLSVGTLFSQHGHTIWHSIHAGLFEYGGCINPTGEIFPGFIHDLSSLSQRPDLACSPQWNDAIEYGVASRHGITPYTPAYDALMKSQVLETVKLHPWQILELLLQRTIKVLSFLPFKSHAPTGAVMDTGLVDLFASLLFILLICIWWLGKEQRPFKLFLTLCLGLAMAPPVLVHSGHIIYNIPANFLQLLIMGLAVMELARKHQVRPQEFAI